MTHDSLIIPKQYSQVFVNERKAGYFHCCRDMECNSSNY